MLDDEPELCSLFKECFSSKDILIETFSVPDDAIVFIKKNPPDFVFLDYRLPKTTGDAVAEILDKNLPKALITGDLNLIPSYPFVELFNKPLDIMRLQKFIDHRRQMKISL